MTNATAKKAVKLHSMAAYKADYKAMVGAVTKAYGSANLLCDRIIANGAADFVLTTPKKEERDLEFTFEGEKITHGEFYDMHIALHVATWPKEKRDIVTLPAASLNDAQKETRKKLLPQKNDGISNLRKALRKRMQNGTAETGARSGPLPLLDRLLRDATKYHKNLKDNEELCAKHGDVIDALDDLLKTLK